MNTATLSPQSVKNASVDNPIHQLLADRWSPYGFADRSVSDADLSSLFEAARWAASSYNEQPWFYILATRKAREEFERILSCLAPANQAWAKNAPVLALGVISLKFSQTKKENRAAAHDLGLASANLVIEATSRDISVHQMIGILPEKARELFQIPENFEAWTALAIGYKARSNELLDGMHERDLAPRHRKPINEFVFSGSWGQAAALNWQTLMRSTQ